MVADGTGIATAIHLARARPEAVQALALGHARVSYDMDAERAPLNRPVFEALGQLLQVDYTG